MKSVLITLLTLSLVSLALAEGPRTEASPTGGSLPAEIDVFRTSQVHTTGSFEDPGVLGVLQLLNTLDLDNPELPDRILGNLMSAYGDVQDDPSAFVQYIYIFDPETETWRKVCMSPFYFSVMDDPEDPIVVCGQTFTFLD